MMILPLCTGVSNPTSLLGGSSGAGAGKATATSVNVTFVGPIPPELMDTLVRGGYYGTIMLVFTKMSSSSSFGSTSTMVPHQVLTLRIVQVESVSNQAVAEGDLVTTVTFRVNKFVIQSWDWSAAKPKAGVKPIRMSWDLATSKAKR